MDRLLRDRLLRDRLLRDRLLATRLLSPSSSICQEAPFLQHDNPRCQEGVPPSLAPLRVVNEHESPLRKNDIGLVKKAKALLPVPSPFWPHLQLLADQNENAQMQLGVEKIRGPRNPLFGMRPIT
jgi:hypothetical protein